MIRKSTPVPVHLLPRKTHLTNYPCVKGGRRTFDQVGGQRFCTTLVQNQTNFVLFISSRRGKKLAFDQQPFGFPDNVYSVTQARVSINELGFLTWSSQTVPHMARVTCIIQ